MMLKSKTALVLLATLTITGIIFIKSPVAHADPLGQVTSYNIPSSNAYPYALTEGSDGNVYFTENGTGKIGQINTSTGHINEYPISLSGGTNSPTDIVNGPDNSLWFSMTSTNGYGYIGKMPSGGGATTQYNLNPYATGVQPLGITVGPDGDLWTVDHNYGGDLYRVSDTGFVTKISLDLPNALPSFIVSDPVNRDVWLGVHDQNLNGYVIKIDMNGNETDYSLPTLASNVYTLTQGPDGDIYFVYGDGQSHDYVGKIIPSTGTITTSDLGAYHGLWYIRTGLDGNLWATDYTAGQIYQITTSLGVTSEKTGLSNPLGMATVSDGNMWFTQYTGNEISKIGEGSYTDIDADGDGLTASQELLQGTSDLVVDTSHDGLSDYVKSRWNTNRQTEFCDSTATNCAYPDPQRQNIYVTVDWMVNPSDPNQGNNSVSYQPSGNQLAALQQAFSNKGINFVYDTGLYGGGQQVPYNQYIYSASNQHPNLLDYKNGGDGIPAEFPSARDHIWHYMLSGYGFDNSAYTGFSYVGGDAYFVSYGILDDFGSSTLGWDGSLDDAVSGSTMHELGHNLCLTSDSTLGQPTACVYSGVDSTSISCSSYPSSMNYNCQLNKTDYSTGQNGPPNDHNDWNALDISEFASVNDNNAYNGIGPIGKNGKVLHIAHGELLHISHSFVSK